MPPPEARVRVGGCDVLVVGTIAGFEPDGARVSDAFGRHRPDAVGLGVPPEDLAGLEALAKDPASFKDMAPPDDATGRRLELLKRFGPIRIPSPDLEAAYARASESGARVEALDLDDHAYAQEYTRRVRLLHVVRANAQRKRLMERDIEAADAYELEAKWDEQANGLKPLKALERLREEAMAGRIRALAGSTGRLLAVVPSARFPGVVALLAGPSPPPPS